MLYWLSAPSTETLAWILIELAYCGKTSLPALLGSTLPLELYTYKSKPLVYHSLRIWVQCRKRFGLHMMSIRSPIYSNHMLPPSVMDSAFKIWNNGRIRSFEDLYINKVFSQLTETFCIPSSHLFRYFQIRNFTRSKYPQFPNKPAETTLDRILEINVQNRSN